MTLGLVGCATTPIAPQPPPATQTWPEERAALQALGHFSLRGRVALSTGSDGFNGGLHWDESADRAQILIDGPLGAGGIRIEVQGRTLRVTTSSGQQLDGEAARAELERRLGFELPLASLRYWIIGAPDPTLPAEESVGSLPRLDHLQQSGWQIDYPLYVAFGGLWLPKRLTLERATARVRVVVDQWDR
jgi:outer membrane lipoprotein LolB